MKAFNNGPLPADRVGLIAAVIRDQVQTNQIDVVVLQEVFDEASGASLRHELLDILPACMWHVGLRACRLDSGLMILSRFPLSDPAFFPHPMAADVEVVATKGVAVVRVHVHRPNGSSSSEVDIFTTHLQGGSRDPTKTGEQVRAAQIAALREHVRNRPPPGQAGTGPVPTVITGDFNIYAFHEMDWFTHQDFFSVDNRHWLVEGQPAATSTCYDTDNDPRVLWSLDTVNDWPVKPNQHVDYILTSATFPLAAPPTLDALRLGGYSDHLAFRGRLVLA